MIKMKKILFTGGGTGGHVTKNLILMEALKKKNPEIELHYIGSYLGKEVDLIKPELAEYHPVASGKLRRYFSLQTVPDFFRVFRGMQQAYSLLKKIKPDLVFSSGGYVALPVAVAASLRKIPLITHETDSFPGLANKMIARMADKILLGYETAKSYFDASKAIYVGNPVSPHLFAGNRIRALEKLKFDPEKKTLLFMGGSQGARQINDLLGEILYELTKKYQVIHLAGEDKLKGRDNPNYRGFEYVTEDYADFLAAVDLIITRGGGNSLAEISALGKKAIVIPLLSAAGDHQSKNAQEMARKNIHLGWQVLGDKELNSAELLESIEKTMSNVTNRRLNRINKRMAEEIVERILAIVLKYLK